MAWRCSRPILTGSRSAALLRTQASSHRISVGQTRAQLPPKMFCFRMPTAAPVTFWSWMLRMKLATSMPVGQARVQGAS